MKETTLCYIERGDDYLMLHRVKKENDVNRDKWIGIGGHLELGETPESCLLREAREETSLTLTEYRYRGIIYFYNDICNSEVMHLYTATDFTGELGFCDEGELEWIPKSRIHDLNLWEGDRIFLRLLDENAPFFKLELFYHGERLVRHQVTMRN